MKKYRITLLVFAALMVLSLAGCDLIQNFIASRTRNIAVIQIYNSNKEKTSRLQPNDTLFVEVQGLKPGGFYQIECLDPENKLITMMTAEADENGIIAPSPLWYDIGFKKGADGKPVLPSSSDLGLRAFNIHVVDLDAAKGARAAAGMTDFKLPFFVVFNTDIQRPQPIVMVGKKESGEFVLENSFESGDELWVKVANLSDLPPQVPASTTARVYIVPFKGSAFDDGEEIAHAILYKDCTIAELTAGVKIDGNDLLSPSNNWSTIPAWAEAKAFSVILDVDNNGQYNIKKAGTNDYYIDGIDGNMVPGFVVKESGPPTTEYVPANIASGGRYRWDYLTWQYDYDYRDEFIVTGNDTQYAWDWQYGGYGIKATWNPYINYNYGNAGVNEEASIYYGTYVDVYIIDTQVGQKPPYGDGNPIIASSKWGLAKITLPVQYSCYNGCGQQTIWRSDGDSNESNGGLKIGDYDVVVDVDRDGKFSKGDIIDNQPKDAFSPWTPREQGGFSVVEQYTIP